MYNIKFKLFEVWKMETKTKVSFIFTLEQNGKKMKKVYIVHDKRKRHDLSKCGWCGYGCGYEMWKRWDEMRFRLGPLNWLLRLVVLCEFYPYINCTVVITVLSVSSSRYCVLWCGGCVRKVLCLCGATRSNSEILRTACLLSIVNFQEMVYVYSRLWILDTGQQATRKWGEILWKTTRMMLMMMMMIVWWWNIWRKEDVIMAE